MVTDYLKSVIRLDFQTGLIWRDFRLQPRSSPKPREVLGYFFLQTSFIKNDTTKIPGTVHMDRVLPNQLIVAHLFSVPNGALKMHYGVHKSPIKKATQAHWNLPYTTTTDDFNIH